MDRQGHAARDGAAHGKWPALPGGLIAAVAAARAPRAADGAGQDPCYASSNTEPVNERAQHLEDRLEPWYLVAALLVIPEIAIEATTQSGSWSRVALVLNWVVWLTFGLGSGIAGLGGVALSQIGNVGPDLGQSYIVDSFMVVVLGGVGQLAGTVYAALGLGFANKLLEAWQGAVLAKIAVLVFIIVFIQKRPQGMFALKGRAVES